MPLEDLIGPNKFIGNLVREWPLGIDPLAEGDDHLRGVKNVLRNSFPTVNQARYPASFVLPPAGESEEKAGALEVAVGTDAQRPAAPSNGALRWNTEKNALEHRKGAQWSVIDPTTAPGDMIAAGANGVLEKVTPSGVGQVPLWNGSNVVYDYPASRGFIDGCVTENGATATRKKVNLGIFRNAANNAVIEITQVLEKDVVFPWTAGDGGGAFMPAGVVGANQTLHYVVFTKNDDGAVEWGLDTSPVGANTPSGYTFQRRIGSLVTTSGGNLPLMVQRGDLFQYASWDDLPQTVITDLPEIAVAPRTMLGVPLGVELSLQGVVNFGDGSQATSGVYMASHFMAGTLQDIQYRAYIAFPGGFVFNNHEFNDIVCSTSGQILMGRHTGDNQIAVFTYGWYDQRGQDA